MRDESREHARVETHLRHARRRPELGRVLAPSQRSVARGRGVESGRMDFTQILFQRRPRVAERENSKRRLRRDGGLFRRGDARFRSERRRGVGDRGKVTTGGRRAIRGEHSQFHRQRRGEMLRAHANARGVARRAQSVHRGRWGEERRVEWHALESHGRYPCRTIGVRRSRVRRGAPRSTGKETVIRLHLTLRAFRRSLGGECLHLIEFDIATLTKPISYRTGSASF